MEYDKISSGINSEKESIDNLLEAEAAEARRISCTIQEIAGTTACKGVQIKGLKNWAIENNCWIESYELLGEYSDRGSENEVYMNSETQIVYKLNDFRYADDNIESFFQRIKIHNNIFADCAYTFHGLAENQDGKICAIISQPFIRADREATIEEIAGALALMGFIPLQEGEYFSNGYIDIFDALPNMFFMELTVICIS